MKTQEEFFQAHQVDGVLSDEQMSQMLNLPEGDTGKPESGEPDATLEKTTQAADAQVAVVDDPAKAAAPPEPGTETPQVILAKDGVHTIPYEKLTEAREGRKQAEEALRIATENAAALLQQLDEAKKTLPADAAKQLQDSVAAAVETGLFGDYSEKELEAGIGKMLAQHTADITQTLEARFATVLGPIQQREAKSAEDLHFLTIASKHPDAEAIAESAEMEQWIKAQPSYTQPALRAVLTDGSAAEVVELFDNFKEATGKTQAAGAGKPNPAAAAQAAIDKVSAKPPTSLTEIPAGSTAHHDEAEAMLEMTSAGLMTKFEGKSPEQIAALMNKVI